MQIPIDYKVSSVEKTQVKEDYKDFQRRRNISSRYMVWLWSTWNDFIARL